MFPSVSMDGSGETLDELGRKQGGRCDAGCDVQQRFEEEDQMGRLRMGRLRLDPDS